MRRILRPEGPHGGRLDADYQLQVASSVWGEKTYTWQRPFLDVLAANYGTGVYQQDFVHGFATARLTINDWVDPHTKTRTSPT